MDQLKNESRDLERVKDVKDEFLRNIRSAMPSEDDLQEIAIETGFPERAVSRKKVMPGELARDEIANHSRRKTFEINVYNAVYDTALQSIQKCFASEKDLCQDLSLLCPSRFSEIAQNGVPREGLTKVFQLLGEESINKARLREELTEFTACWLQLKGADAVTLQLSDGDDACSDDETSLRDALAEPAICKESALCNNCLSCVHRFLYRYNFHSEEYRSLHPIYKPAITLPLAQVTWEKSLFYFLQAKDNQDKALQYAGG